jgi:hypothetical protein
MEIQFDDPTEAPLPPKEVRIRKAAMQLQPDGMRIRVELELSPFQEKPVIEIKVINPDDVVSVSTTVVEAATPKMSLTMHLKPRSETEHLRGLFLVRYPELGEVDRLVVKIL